MPPAPATAATGRNSVRPFAPGQVWTYYTRPGEESSRMVICRVESDPRLGEIVHIQVNGIRLKNKHAPAGFSGQIGHMPYAADALRKCLVNLEVEGAALPSFESGYGEWRSAFDQGKAGVWTASISEAIAGMEKGMSK
jgi:hypothetical protein